MFIFFAGLSLKSQELTAIFLGSRLYCSFVMEYDVHTVLDLATLAATIWVIYMMRFNLNASYMHEKDNVPNYYVVTYFFPKFTFIFGFINSCDLWYEHGHNNLTLTLFNWIHWIY